MKKEIYNVGGICSFINGSASLGWRGLIVGILVAVVPQALTLWGAEGILYKRIIGKNIKI